jgi:hypothetical protein
MKNKERIAILEAEISRLKVANRNNIYRIEAIESHLAEQHKGANFSKLNPSEKPNSCEQYELPDFVPDWKDAPEWAKYLTMDKHGTWMWWDIKPNFNHEMWFIMDNKKRVYINRECTNPDRLQPEYWKNSLQERPAKTAPDYTHLLPDGYEFCQESDAEKWVKVEEIPEKIMQSRLGLVGYTDNREPSEDYKPYWKPIRPIQYKVTTHEIVTAVPDPYQPDWSQAPEGAVAHSWDMDGRGWFFGIEHRSSEWGINLTESNLTLPADLDWKQSLRVKPN